MGDVDLAKIVYEQLSGSSKPAAEERTVLRVEVLSARGLLLDSNYLHFLELHVLYAGKRFTSPEVQGVNEPVFDFSVHFDVFGNFPVTFANLLKRKDTVLIYLTTTLKSRDDFSYVGFQPSKVLFAVAVIDFRYALMHSGDFISVELLPCELDGINMGCSSGVLFLRLSLENLPGEKITGILDPHEVEEVMTRDINRMSEENREFYHIARTWWARIKKVYPYIEGRSLKVLAKDESGQHRFVCSYLAPIQPPRELNGPRFAARFVSLLAYNRRTVSLLGGTRSEDSWRAPHAFLSCRQGDVEVKRTIFSSHSGFPRDFFTHFRVTHPIVFHSNPIPYASISTPGTRNPSVRSASRVWAGRVGSARDNKRSSGQHHRNTWDCCC